MNVVLGAPAPPSPLPVDMLYRRTALTGIAFDTTDDLQPLPGLAAQERTHDALRLSAAVQATGFNVFAVGTGSAGIGASIRELLSQEAASSPTPPDWIYVHNFAAPHQPRAISMPAGRAPGFASALAGLIDDLQVELSALFEAEDFQARRGAVEAMFNGRAERAFAALGEQASGRSVAILRTPMGFTLAPMQDGKMVPPEEFNQWDAARQAAARDRIAEVEKELEQTLRSIPRIEKERRDAVRALERETAGFAIDRAVGELVTEFEGLPDVTQYLAQVRDDLVQNVQLFIGPQAQPPELSSAGLRVGAPFDRYQANVLVTQATGAGAPVVEELHPTLGNLVGRVEHLPVQGALISNFRLIKAGALHRANGGVIIIDARALLAEPFSWAALKRALLQGRVTIEDVAQQIGLAGTVSLEPAPIPLQVKIVLVGDPLTHHLLAMLDPDFNLHFRITADFDDALPRSPDHEAMLARIIAGMAQAAKLRPLSRAAVQRCIEQAARSADDAGRLALLPEQMRALLIEADHWALQRGQAVITEDDVQRATTAQRRRVARPYEHSLESTRRGIALIATDGSRIGQVNGLSVFEYGGHRFGRASRITARVRPGSGRILDIEREVELGGPLHSKGVMILSGFLAGRYALDVPMSLFASLVFEQSYAGVEGDSASCAELLALLSALSGLPLRQDIAVTGSVNQLGDIQAIGGSSDKIEGFFDLCVQAGLTGTQGVLLPAANVQHLMLRDDVVAACGSGRFAIHTMATIDDALTLLTWQPAGERGSDGTFPAGSVNRLIEDRLVSFARSRDRRGPTATGLE